MIIPRQGGGQQQREEVSPLSKAICERLPCECRTVHLHATTPTKTVYLVVTVQEAPPGWKHVESTPHEVGDYLKGVGEYIDELLDRRHPSDQEVRELTGKP